MFNNTQCIINNTQREGRGGLGEVGDQPKDLDACI